MEQALGPALAHRAEELLEALVAPQKAQAVLGHPVARDETGQVVVGDGAFLLHLHHVVHAGERGVDDGNAVHLLAGEQAHDPDPQAAAVLLRHLEQALVAGLARGDGPHDRGAQLLEHLGEIGEVVGAVVVEQRDVLLARVARHLVVEVVRPHHLELLGEQVLAHAHVHRAHEHVVLAQKRVVVEGDQRRGAGCGIADLRRHADQRLPKMEHPLALVHLGIGRQEHGPHVGGVLGPLRPQRHEALGRPLLESHSVALVGERPVQILHHAPEGRLVHPGRQGHELVAADAVQARTLERTAHHLRAEA